MSVINRDPKSILGSPRNSSPLMKQDSSSGLILPERLVKTEERPPTVDEHLDRVDYSFLNDGSYVPSAFALQFVNFIKLVNGEQGESHPSPVVHMRMLDRVVESELDRLANLCSRGIAKTTDRKSVV